ncbi:LEAF RUST 10 DISEASE-RESISTANCE LOCUS RECEPTOR-LIKE PROTEIN KINASE-like 2.5 [Iris pallida]|uniref:LEAF RUST 10 DISEASE-RESISTANCE LOCUS RECEPTOR-LIKE PROTEIN KINASE-like 2.5 n=1 Tax=Iris pallida TaxID=29817 RepID=A0AAX6DUU3_IRIPA|nr:LEAF RUST 10 DISEASE-RESISTANCE LOCUS RECEPTOR-LIKE PROTEIN KINASE-like 2.5 [Iris pallida]
MGKLVLCFILSFLLFSSPGLALYREICSSSCGRIQHIRWPFRLKGDPHYCGNPKYELVCDAGTNSTVLSMSSRKYYVTRLSYDPNELRIVDTDLASGKCRLPLASISPRIVREDGRYELSSTDWASFVNCTTGTIRQDTYHQVPCLNQSSIYVTSGYQVKDLVPSCGFLATTPTIGSINKSSNTDHMFELLKMGFTISWIRTPKTFGYCFRAYLSSAKYVANGGLYQMMVDIVLLELGFCKCVYESKDVSNLPIALAFVMALNFILIALVGRLILAPLCVWAFLGLEFYKTYLSLDAIEKFLQNQPPLAPRRYAYKDIASFTNHFKERIGQGGFGMVFRGKLPHGQPVAVKMLKSSRCTDGEEFISEVATIGRIHHVNVVRLLGFCSEGSKRALVYEYLPKGSLDKYIFSASSSTATETPRRFTWEKLNDIALGVARGIDYLHRGCDMRILHFDIKPHNILLDDDFTPKVSDFGLAKLYPKDYSVVSLSVARGTIGYIAPELVSRSFGVISHKSDVYSYGMLLLEMAGGRRNVNPAAENSSEMYYPSWIYDRLNQREGLVGTGDRPFVERRQPINDVERRLCKVGLWCIQMKPSDRPAMSNVLEMLEADVQALPMPPKPFFSSSPEPDFLDQSWSDSSVSESSIIEEEY